jgi:hypothetical protein
MSSRVGYHPFSPIGRSVVAYDVNRDDISSSTDAPGILAFVQVGQANTNAAKQKAMSKAKMPRKKIWQKNDLHIP